MKPDTYIRPTEAGHWYRPDGNPCHEVPYANPDKGMRPATLRDARKLGLFPSVTALTRTVSDFRHWWGEQVALSALTLPEVEGETADERLVRIMRDAEAHMSEARERGIAMHASLKGAMRGEQLPPEHRPFLESIPKLLQKRIPQWGGSYWMAELAFACELGYGGQVDACLFDANGKCVAVVDFKTKDMTSAKMPHRLTYPEHAMQLAAYANGLGNPEALLVNLYISTAETGLYVEHVWKDNLRWLAAFKGLLQYWRNANNYYPPLKGDR